jgi:hypothetical protein
MSGSFALGLLFALATERLRAILPELEAMVSDGFITLERVEVVVYRAEGRWGSGEAADT